MKELPKNKLAPKGTLPFNPNKCSACRFWEKVSSKNGICNNMKVYFFAEPDNNIKIRTPRFGLCDNFRTRDGIKDETS